MEEVTTFVNEQLLPHWPFFAAMVIFMISGQVMSKAVFSKTAHETLKPVWFWWWGRKTLALQPILLGAILGVFWPNPEPGVTAGIASAGYFALAGGLSVWGYEFLKGLAKKRGINLSLPGVESTPPAPVKDDNAPDPDASTLTD